MSGFSRSEKQKFLRQLGTLIILHRSIKGYSVEQLAKLCDMHPEHLSGIEGGEICPMIKTVYRIAYELDISPKELFV